MAGLLDTVIDWMTSAQRAQQMQGLGNNIKQGLLGIQNAANVTNQAARDTLRTGQLRPNTPAQTALDSNMVNAAMQLGPQAIVWHGSPHKFDKFDSSKIGTGEGAQAYGHGLYLAESPDVAGSYQSALTHKNYSSLVQKGPNNYDVIAPDGTKIIEGAWLGKASKAKEAYDAAQSGNLYKVDLPDDAIAKMLDWDKPLSEQSDFVKQALQSLDTRYGPVRGRARIVDLEKNPFISGGDIYNDSARALVPDGARDIWRGATPVSGQGARISDKLRELGIPGIRYLDGGSRGTGAGTSNFVVFPGNENLLTILERNGQNLGLGQ